MWLLRCLEALKDSSVFVRNHVGDVSFLVGNNRIENVLFTHFLKTKRPVSCVGETSIKVEGEVLFHV